jgi:hypothetical protein
MPRVKRERGPNSISRWTPILLVHIYRHAKAGLSNEAIARVMDITSNRFVKWKRDRPEVAQALALARKEAPMDNSFVRYFYSQLDPRLQALWNEIENANNLGGGIAQLDAILGDHGTKARQSLYLHALISSHFSPTRAMEKVGIDKRTLDHWINNDPDFPELVEQIQYHKKNYFEEALVKLVEAGDKSAILHANRSVNRDRGYGRHSDMTVTVNGNVNHNHVLDLSELNLSLACRTEIANALRELEQKKEAARLLSQRPIEERLRTRVEDQIIASIAEQPQDSNGEA